MQLNETAPMYEVGLGCTRLAWFYTSSTAFLQLPLVLQVVPAEGTRFFFQA